MEQIHTIKFDVWNDWAVELFHCQQGRSNFCIISEDAVKALLYQGRHGRNPNGSECGSLGPSQETTAASEYML